MEVKARHGHEWSGQETYLHVSGNGSSTTALLGSSIRTLYHHQHQHQHQHQHGVSVDVEATNNEMAWLSALSGRPPPHLPRYLHADSFPGESREGALLLLFLSSCC